MQSTAKTSYARRTQLAGSKERVTTDAPFRLRSGEQLAELTMAYETWGRLSENRDNAILLLPGLSPSAHARSSQVDDSPGWWEGMIGPNLALDTNRFCIICVNNLGSCFGSTGPASINPKTSMPYATDFPRLTMEDLAHAANRVVDALGIKRLHAVVGASMGGLIALAYGLCFPDGATKLSMISSGPRCQAHAIAVHSLQREAICNDPLWQNGRYGAKDCPLPGMKLARKIGMTSYRSAMELEQRFSNQKVDLGIQEQFGFEFQIESYLDGATRRFVDRFDANSYLYLSRAMDHFDARFHGTNLVQALKTINTDAVQIIGIESDALFPLRQQNELAEAFEAADRPVQFVALDSEKGHDAFLVEVDLFTPVLHEFLA